MADVGPVDARAGLLGARRSALVPAQRAAAAPLRPRLRRHARRTRSAARSTRCSCPASPKGSSRASRSRIRCCSTPSGAALEAALAGPGGSLRRRARAAATRAGRGARAVGGVLPTHRSAARPRARAVVLRARSPARRVRRAARPARAGAHAGPSGAGLAGARRSRRGDRRLRVRSRHAGAAARAAGARRHAARRAT